MLERLARQTMPMRIKSGPLVIHWPLANKGALTLQSRLSRVPYDLTNNGTVTRVAGPNSNIPDAAHFVVASTQYFSIGSTPDLLRPRNRPFGFAAWVMADGVAADATRAIAGIYGASGSREWLLFQTNATGRYSMIVSPDGAATPSVTSALTISDEVWSFVAGWWNGERIFISVNMESTVPDDVTTTSIFTSTTDFRIGSNAANNHWSGDIASCTYWLGRIPTRAELEFLYNAGRGYGLV